MQSIDKSLTRMRFSERASGIYHAKRLGVALGPGLPAGLVDLGMLIALKQLRIPVQMISGTSMGSVIGALYASGLEPEDIRGHAISLFEKNGVMQLLMQDMKIPRLGFSTGEKLIEELKKMAGWDPEFYELRVPLYLIAADKNSQQNVLLHHGRVFDAVRASLAMPLLVNEKQLGGMKLADGAIFAPVDTNILYNEGADFVMAIHAKTIRSERSRELPWRSKLEPYLLKALGWKIDPEIHLSKPACDILLRPRVPLALTADGKRVNEIIQLGIRITYEVLHEIEKGNVSKRTALSENILTKKTASKINLEMEEKADALENYLKEIEQKTAKMSDAELTREFPKFARRFQAFLDDITGHYPDLEAAREALKDKIKIFSHLVDQSPFMSRCLHKPLGYAGDYQMMNYLYDDQVFEAQGNMGKLLNYYLFSSPAANAVRNRAKIVQGFVKHRFGQKTQLAVASIACGPAREVAATLKSLTDDSKDGKIIWTLLDQDRQALENARKNISSHIMLEPKLIHAGVRDLLKNTIVLDQQDIIYSLGLFDYLEDKVAVSLIRRLYAEVNPGGMLLIGNFHNNNPLRTLMEGVMEWHLIHRTEEELLALGKAGAPEGRHFVMAEPEGVNLILVTSRPLVVDK